MRTLATALLLSVALSSTALAQSAQAPAGAPAAQGQQGQVYNHKIPQLHRAEIDALLADPSKVLFVDLRRPDEISKIGSFPVYLNVQVADVEKDLALIPKERPIVTVSNHAGRAGIAGDELKDKGYNVIGAVGSQLYEQEGGKIVKIAVPPPPQAAAQPAAPAAQGQQAQVYNHKVPKLTRADVDALDPSKVLFIDVRRPDEISANGSFPVYLNVQVADVERDLAFIPKERAIVTVATRTVRSGAVGDQLKEKGYNVLGAIGSQDYEEQGVKIVKVAVPPPPQAAAQPADQTQGQQAQAYNHKVPKLTRAEVDALDPGKVLFVDVRRPDEISAHGSFPVYLNVQVADVEKDLAFIPKDRAIVTVANRTGRSGTVGDQLKDKGYRVLGAIGSQDYEEQGARIVKVAVPPRPQPAAQPAAPAAQGQQAQAYNHKVPKLTRAEVDALDPSRILFVDVRRPDEISALGSFPVYLNVQVADVEKDLALIPKERAIVTVASRTNRNGVVGDLLKEKGYNVLGVIGSQDYEEQGSKIVKIAVPAPQTAAPVAAGPAAPAAVAAQEVAPAPTQVAPPAAAAARN